MKSFTASGSGPLRMEPSDQHPLKCLIVWIVSSWQCLGGSVWVAVDRVFNGLGFKVRNASLGGVFRYSISRFCSFNLRTHRVIQTVQFEKGRFLREKYLLTQWIRQTSGLDVELLA